MVLPESEAKLKPDDSGLLITSSNETSLVNIMKGMTPPLIQNNQIQKTKNKNDNLEKNIKNKNNENSNSYRTNQRNLIHSSLNKFNSKTIEALLNSQMKNRNNKNKRHYNYSNLLQKMKN